MEREEHTGPDRPITNFEYLLQPENAIFRAVKIYVFFSTSWN